MKVIFTVFWIFSVVAGRFAACVSGVVVGDGMGRFVPVVGVLGGPAWSAALAAGVGFIVVLCWDCVAHFEGSS